MPRCCAGDACRHPGIPYMTFAHYCLACPESDNGNRGHGPCLIAVRLLDAGKLFRVDNVGNSFVMEEHLTEVGRTKHDNEANGICHTCWAKLSEEPQPIREPTQNMVVDLMSMYSTKTEAVATPAIMRHLRLFFEEEEGNDSKSQAYFENKIRQTCVTGATGGRRGGGSRGREGGGSGLMDDIATADRREGVRREVAALPVRGDLAASVPARRGQAGQAPQGGGRGGGGRGGGGRVGGRVGDRRSFVDDSSAYKTYIPKLVSIALYCLDDREKHGFINPTMLPVLTAMDEHDREDHDRINAERLARNKKPLQFK